MSGLYLVLWDDEHNERGESMFDRVLTPTKGGWPHITVAYTGKHASKGELKKLACELFDEWALDTVKLTKAHINTFTDGEGRVRNDVLVSVAAPYVALINRSRARVREAFDETVHARFFMRDPHVTVGIHATSEAAKEHMERVNKLLPLQVTVTGVTID